jgi:hypothetical protein
MIRLVQLIKTDAKAAKRGLMDKHREAAPLVA